MNYVNDYKLRPTKVEMQQFPINSPEMQVSPFWNVILESNTYSNG